MSIIDISNWTTDEINNSIDTFKDTSLTDIGMVNCDIDSINIVGGITTATLWINEDIGIDGYTGTAPLKIYKEDKVEIKLNSPLLEGDTIEVKDGKLCHVHRYGVVVLDGSESWWNSSLTPQEELVNNNLAVFGLTQLNPEPGIVVATHGSHLSCNNFITLPPQKTNQNGYVNKEGISSHYQRPGQIRICINRSKLPSVDVNGFKQWLSENPTTVVYELAEPYYEDITPLQSSIILKTFLESSMIINTNLPIKTNVSYRTNVPSISTLSNRVTEVSESDNVIHNLMNIIDDEVDE